METKDRARMLVGRCQISPLRERLGAMVGEELHHWGPSFAEIYYEFMRNLLPGYRGPRGFVEWAFLAFHAQVAKLLLLPTKLHKDYFDVHQGNDPRFYGLYSRVDGMYVQPLHYGLSLAYKMHFLPPPAPWQGWAPEWWPFREGIVSDCVARALRG
jgi:hypothetical protein